MIPSEPSSAISKLISASKTPICLYPLILHKNLSDPSDLGQQELKLKNEILDQFVFCQAVCEEDGNRIVLERQLTDRFQ